jgi:hypothetical protein
MKSEQPSVRQNREEIRGRDRGSKSGNGKDEDAQEAIGLEGVSRKDFFAYMVDHKYIYAPTGDLWPVSSVNARIPPIPLVDSSGTPVLYKKGKQKGEQVVLTAAEWLDRHKPVEQMTWAPGKPMIIFDRLVSEGGWIDRRRVAVFNRYRPPLIVPGNAAEAQMWLDHIDKVYPDDAEHIIRWLAHRRQRPHEKINHALVLGGAQGIGKDTLLEGPRRAVGPWNFDEVSPQQLMGRFNGFLKSVILRVNEARDLGEVNRYAFYDHLKAYLASPPETLRCDEKNTKEYRIFNRVGPVITTNHKTDGIYLPSDDRRHYVAWSDLTKGSFVDGYWNRIWRWYDKGGDRHVAAYLDELDLSKFDPKAPPPKTAAFWDIVDANRAPEEGELQDVIEELKDPSAITITMLLTKTTGSLDDWLRDRRNRRAIPHRLEKCGYVSVRNNNADDGLWKVAKIDTGGGKTSSRQVIYAKATLSLRDRFAAAEQLAQRAV